MLACKVISNMAERTEMTIEPGKVYSGVCECCGSQTQTVSGFVYARDAALAVYYVTGTVGRPDHGLSIDLIVGTWGEAACGDRHGISVVFRSGSDGGFMVTDAAPRLRASKLVDVAMTRPDVVSGPWETTAFSVLDAIWCQDQRVLSMVSSAPNTEVPPA